MSYSIVGQLFFPSRNDTNKLSNTLNYLRARELFTWLEFDDELDGQTVIIEFNTVPEVLKDLEKTGYYRKGCSGIRQLSVLELSDKGIAFYISGGWGDGIIFVSSHCIDCIHTISQKRLAEIAENCAQINSAT